MDKKKILTYVSKSYVKNHLDYSRVKAIASILRRSDLKKYIQGLKNAESKKNVIIVLPFKNNSQISIFQKIFPNRNIVYRTDPSLIAGVRIIDNDQIFEFDLKDTLGNIIANIKENYD